MSDLAALDKFAQGYAKAWCSHNPESVAAFFAERGSIRINNGPPAVGRAAIANEARAFMTTFPDMIVTFDKLERRRDRTAFHWTLIGTESAVMSFGRSTTMDSSENQKAILTAWSTNVSSSTDWTQVGAIDLNRSRGL